MGEEQNSIFNGTSSYGNRKQDDRIFS